MKEEAKALGARLAEARRRAQMTQRDVQNQTGLDQATVARMESGKREVSALEIARLARLYGVAVMDLLDMAPVALGSEASEVSRIGLLNENGYHGAGVQLR